MPLPGLSLFGFLDVAQALMYLENACVTANSTQAQLQAMWVAARARLGAAIPGAGHPDVQNLPADPTTTAHLATARNTWPPIAAQGWEFRLIEIDPLLAYQHHISLNHSDGHCAALQGIPSMNELLTVCLPSQPPQIPEPFSSMQDHSIALRSEDLNIRLLHRGPMAAGQLGIVVGQGLPLMQVVKCNDRCYLRNGFHRAYGMRKRGATHVPCLYKEIGDYGFVGVRADGSTFNQALMESNNPPTVGHFTNDRAFDVQLRKVSKIIQVSWSEHVLTDE